MKCARCGQAPSGGNPQGSPDGLCLDCGLRADREKRIVEFAGLNAKRLERLDSMENPEEAITRLLVDPAYREPLERHLTTTWANRRPDLIEFLLGALLWQRREIDRMHHSVLTIMRARLTASLHQHVGQPVAAEAKEAVANELRAALAEAKRNGWIV